MIAIEAQTAPHPCRRWRSCDGRSLIETLAVVTIAVTLTAMAVPQLISGRRLIRSATLVREVASQLRLTRQQAMMQRQAFTFQYDNTAKTVKIFDHNNNNNANAGCNITGVAVLSASGYPNTPCATVMMTIPLATGTTLPASELSYGIPSSITSTPLDDGTTLTALSGSGVVNITFQADGTVVDSSGNYTNPTLYFYNNMAAKETASAVSILGAAGRIKVWRYSSSASKYTE